MPQRAIYILHQNLMNSSQRHGVEGMPPSLRLFSFFCDYVLDDNYYIVLGLVIMFIFVVCCFRCLFG